MPRGVRGDLRGSLRVIFRKADALEQAADFFSGILDVQMFEGKFHGRHLIVRVKNLEIARQAEAFCFAAQHPRRKRMKSSDPRIVIRPSLADEQIADALFHLRRSFVREGYRENRMAGDTLLDQVRDPVSNGARFPRARTGKYEDGTINRGRGLVLPGIQFVKEYHVGRRARFGGCILSDADAFGKSALARCTTPSLDGPREASNRWSVRWFCGAGVPRQFLNSPRGSKMPERCLRYL